MYDREKDWKGYETIDYISGKLKLSFSSSNIFKYFIFLMSVSQLYLHCQISHFGKKEKKKKHISVVILLKSFY